MFATKGIRFKNPPLINVLCEFRFRETATIPNIILGRFYEQIEEDFPTVETHRGIGLQTQEGMLDPTIVMEERTQFANRDGTRRIQLGAGLLIINQLKPYRDYISFRTFIENTLETYRKVAKPKAVQRIGLKYVNLIEVKNNQTLGEVFNIGFIIPSMFKSFPNPYLLNMEFDYSDGRDKLIIALSQNRQKDSHVNAVTLDFDYVLNIPEGINDNLLEWLDEAHNEIEKAFHACLTESVLNSFEFEDV